MSAGQGRGPVGRDVYWRRRLLLLAAVIAVVWIALKVAGSFGGDDPAPTAAPPSPTPTTVATTAPPPDQVDVVLETSATPCAPDDVRIVPSVAAGAESGAPVPIDLMISTVDEKACTFEPTADELLVVIDAAKAPVYDSSVCRAAFFDQPVAVPAGWGTVTRVEWSGKGSGTGCSPSEGFAPPGTYTIQIGTYGGEPGQATFTLVERRPEPAPTPTAPKKTPTAVSTAD